MLQTVLSCYRSENVPTNLVVLHISHHMRSAAISNLFNLTYKALNTWKEAKNNPWFINTI